MNEQYFEDSYPLSPVQQGMLFHDLYAPHSGMYLQQLICTFHEELNVTAFKKAWQRVIARHPVLRTSFHFEDLNEPIQRVHKNFDLRWVEEDCRRMPLKEQNNQLETYLQNDNQQGFKLTEAPLIRLALFQMGDIDYKFIWTYHHAVMDGRSRFILLNEVFSFYEALCNGKDIKLKHPRPYRDYIDWLTKEDFNKAKDFWRRMLEGFNTHTPLVVDSILHGTSEKTAKGYKKQETRLSDNLTRALQSVSKQHGLTPNTLLQGAWALLLSRYSGEQDVVFGAPRACRRSGIKGAESMVGLFINTLPVKIGVPSKRQLLPWLKELRSEWIAMRDYEHTPIIKIQEWSDIPAGKPLFESILSFENYDLNSAMQAQGGKWVNREFKLIGFTNYPIAVAGYLESELLLEVVYNRCRFKDRTIARMLGHIKTLLQNMIENPVQRISDLKILTDIERKQLLVDWNDTQKDYPKDQCIQDLFEEQVERSPDCIAVVFGEEAVTYRELNRRANQLAHHLQRLGVGPDALVGIFVNRSIEMVVALLGVLKAGGAYVPLDPSFPTERLALVLEDAQVAVLLTQKDLISILPEIHATVICLDKDWESVVSQKPVDDPISEANAEHLVYVIYTSGSTGKPKGVQISHRALVNFLFSMMKKPGLTDQDVLLAVTTLSFDIAMLELLLPLIVGARVVIVSSEEASDGNRLLNRLADCGATVMQATPASWRLLLAAGWQGDDHLKILCGGEALPRELATQLLQRGHSLWNMYGPTETTIWSTVNKLKDKEGPVLIGFPIANTQIYILDQHLQPVPVGVPGELHIGGDSLARGYLNRPELTAERFIANPFNAMPGSRLYKTGDLAKYLPDGNIEVLGRLDFQVKVRGFRIELGDIETTLEQHPAVQQAVVIVREDIPGDKQLVTYIVSNDHQTVAVNTLRSFLHKKLPSYMVPSLFEMIDALPLTPNGKIDRRALPAPDRIRRETSEALVAPRDALELQLTKTWERVLGVQPIGVHDNFFELGGHSLLAVRLIAQIEKILGKNLPLVTLFQAPTVEQLAIILREQGWSAPLSSLEAIEIGGAGSKGLMRMKREIADHFSAKSYAHLKQLYHKIKQHPGYRYLKRQHIKAKSIFTKRFLSYSPAQLEEKLRKIGLTEADTVYMHSAFNAFNGFLGGPQQIIDCILNVIGESGNLLMVSMAYRGSTEEYLKAVKTFDAIKTESSMGIITEIFRRKKDVVRSLNPAHPILAFGPNAKWIVSDHDKTMYSCGKGSPFEKMLKLNTKAFFFDVSFRVMTFFHYLEDRFKDTAPVRVYDDEPLESTVIDSNGNEMPVKMYVFSKEARDNRSAQLIERELKNKNLMKTDSIGNTKLTLVNLKNIVGVAEQLVNAGTHFYKA